MTNRGLHEMTFGAVWDDLSRFRLIDVPVLFSARSSPDARTSRHETSLVDVQFRRDIGDRGEQWEGKGVRSSPTPT